MKGLIKNYVFSNIKVGQKIPRKLKKGLKSVILERPVEKPYEFTTTDIGDGFLRVNCDLSFNVRATGPETKWKRKARTLVRRSYIMSVQNQISRIINNRIKETKQ